jgi:hypothetical protein
VNSSISFIVPSIVPYGDEDEALGVYIFISAVFLGLQIFMGIKGNEMTAKNYLESGWVFSEPDSEQVKIAKARWGFLG